MQTLRRLYARRRLRIHDAKSAVARPQDRAFLGYSFWYSKGGVVRRRVAPKALKTRKDRVRRITGRSTGRSQRTIVEELRGYLRGWKEYFHLAETPGVFRALDEWIRHRLRAIQLKHWRRGRTVYRELRVRGLSPRVAAQVAVGTRRWWRNASLALHIALPATY